MKEHNELEDLFRSSFEEFEVTPPTTVKKAIDSAIDKKAGMWWLLLLLIVPVALLSVFIWNKNSVAPSELTNKAEQHDNSYVATTEVPQQSNEVHSTVSRQASINNSKKDTGAQVSENVQRNSIPSLDTHTALKPSRTSNEPRKQTTFRKTKKNATKSFNLRHKNKTNQQPQMGVVTANTVVQPLDKTPVRAKALKAHQAIHAYGWKHQLLVTKDSINLTQNSLNTATDSTQLDDKKEDKKPAQWMLGLAVGPGFGKQSVSSGEINESNNLLAQLSIARSIGATNGSIQLSTGWMKRNQEYGYTVSSDTVIQNGMDTIIIYGGQNGDSIIGTSIQPHYDTLYANTPYFKNYRTSVFYWQTGWSQNIPITKQFGANINVTGGLNVLKISYENSQSHRSVWNLGMGAGVYYDYKRFRFEAMANYRIEYWKPVSGTPFDGNRRTQFTPTVGICYRF